jgi:hypothetical protein
MLGQDSVFGTALVRSLHNGPAPDLEGAKNVFGRYRALGSGCPLVDDIDPTISQSSSFGENARLIRTVPSDDLMKELHEDAIAHKDVGSNPHCGAPLLGESADDGFRGHAFRKHGVSGEQRHVVL